MNHAAFVSAYTSNRIKVHLLKDQAAALYRRADLIPPGGRRRILVQRCAAMSAVVGGAVSALWLPLWMGAVVVVAGLFAFTSLKDANMENLMATILSDPRVYKAARDEGVFRIETV